jgi:predicted aminopeptidase
MLLHVRNLLLAAFALSLGGCASMGYYGQAIGGQMSVMSRAKPISRLLEDPDLAPDLRQRLMRVQVIRDYASRELALPDNDSYRRYADLERPYALWNIFATPEFSLKSKRWCYPIAGCMSYRSYYSQADAEREAQQLREQGFDVHVGGVTAYSTSGWFDDPVLNTMIRYPEPELAGTVFHELAHETVLVAGDTAFNESFATTVEREGVRRWLASNNAPSEYPLYLARSRRHADFVALIMRYRPQLEALYSSTTTDDVKRSRKKQILQTLRADYTTLKTAWDGYSGYDRWIENLNNAKFLSIGLYHGHVRAFEALLARHGGDLPQFYRAAKKLAKMGHAERDQQLARLAVEVETAAAPIAANIKED